jgi:CRISPR-associated protein Cas2
MVVIILEKVPVSSRGELSRWMVEPHPGVFVGHVSAMVREKLWEKCCKNCKEGGVVQLWTTNNEQHYQMRTFGHTDRKVIDMEGLQLVSVPQTQKNGKKGD